MNNKYEVRGDVVDIIIESKKFGRMVAVVSANKLEKVMEMDNWNPMWSKFSKTFYVVGFLRGVKTTRFYLHRWITDAPREMVVDHFNNNGLINTDDNLRVITHSGNQQNRKGAQLNNASGVRGITFDKSRGKWMARTTVGGNVIFLGRFKSVSEAEQAVIEGRAKYMPYSKEALAN